MTAIKEATLPSGPHKCDECPAEYTTPVNLRAHKAKMHSPQLELATTRELLAELRRRSEKWSGQRASGYLADWVDDAYANLEGLPIIDGKREPE